jgi:hypothetical protein
MVERVLVLQPEEKCALLWSYGMVVPALVTQSPELPATSVARTRK